MRILLLRCLPKPLLSSSLAAAMRCWGPKTLSSPSMTLIRKRTTETPSSVDSRIFFASAMSNSDSSDGPELFLLRDGSRGLSRMKSMASSRPYLVSSLAASSLWQILKSGRSSVMTSMRKSMTSVAVVGLGLDSVGEVHGLLVNGEYNSMYVLQRIVTCDRGCVKGSFPNRDLSDSAIFRLLAG